jgi:hypothetical protein
MFKIRISSYEQALHPKVMNEDGIIKDFQQEEKRLESMMKTYFKLFEDPNEFVNVMDDLQ